MTRLIGSTFAVGLTIGALGIGCETEPRPAALASAATAAPEKAAAPPEALSHDERAHSPSTPSRPPRAIRRVEDARPTTRAELGRQGRLPAQQAAGKLPAWQESGPVAIRPIVVGPAPADGAERYRRFEAQWKALDAATRGMSDQARAAQRAALKQRVILEGRP